jgi:hypothetical protein
MMAEVDYEAIRLQLQSIGHSLRQTNQELRRRCQELEQEFAVPPFSYYNRFVNQMVLKSILRVSKLARGSVARVREWRRS